MRDDYSGLQEIIEAIDIQREYDTHDLQTTEIRFLIEKYDSDLKQLAYIAYALGFKRGFEQGENE